MASECFFFNAARRISGLALLHQKCCLLLRVLVLLSKTSLDTRKSKKKHQHKLSPTYLNKTLYLRHCFRIVKYLDREHTVQFISPLIFNFIIYFPFFSLTVKRGEGGEGLGSAPWRGGPRPPFPPPSFPHKPASPSFPGSQLPDRSHTTPCL